jgi:hypothetical protein
MKHRFRCYALILGLAVAALAQAPTPPLDTHTDGQGDVKLPNGKSQRDEILKAEHQQNLKDAAQLVDLAQQLQESLEKGDRYVLSISDLKRTEDIEKLAKKIHSRLQH